ncbi:MAG: GGDEF domain-containing protein, partial [Rhodospirillales bacterium]
LVDLARNIQDVTAPSGSGLLPASSLSGELAEVTREVGGMLERINYLTHIDTLTGLHNRAYFNERAAHALALAKRNQTRAAILLVDLDGFKEVNDTLGYEAGDRLLVAISNMLKVILRESDSLARFGGDEFLLLAENLPSLTGPAELAKRILDVFRHPMPPEDIRQGRTCSIGIAVYPDDAATLDELLRKADIAMYRAKSVGGNTWRCHAESLNCHPETAKKEGPENPAPAEG